MRFDHLPERGESLSRFIFSTRHFSAAQSRVKPDALLPGKDSLETSVFRTAGLDHTATREICDRVGETAARTLKAWGNVRAGVVFDAGLDVRPDNVPERHAAIIGWPRQKDQQISQAQRRAEAATLHPPS